MANLKRTALAPTLKPPSGFQAKGFTVDGLPGHFIETTWADFVEGCSAMGNPTYLSNMSYADCSMDLREHLSKTPMGDFTDLKSLKDSLDASLMGTLRERVKRRKVDTWDGSDLEIDSIINRRGIPFSERRKVRKQRPVLVIAQRLANVITSGGDHKWNAAQGLWLTEYFDAKGYDVEFYAYSDHHEIGDHENRVATSVRIKGRGERMYPDLMRRALCDGQVYRNSWWGYRGLYGASWSCAMGNYGHSVGDHLSGFTWTDNARVINLPLTLTEEQCVRNIQRVLEGDTDMCRDYRD